MVPKHKGLVPLQKESSGLSKVLGRISKNLGTPIGGGVGGALAGSGVSLAQEASREGPKNYRAALLRGGILGGALGAGSGAARRKLRDIQLLTGKSGTSLAGEAAKRTGQSFKRFGQRQLHGFTGRGDPAAMGFKGTRQAKQEARVAIARSKDKARGLPPSQAAQVQQDTLKKLKDIRREGVINQRAMDKGLTSIPGTAKGLIKDPRGTVRAAWDQSTGGKGLRGSAMVMGLPLALSGPSLMKGDESAYGGPSIAEKATTLGADIAGTTLTGGMGLIPSIAAFSGLSGGSRAAAKAIGGNSDKKPNLKSKPKPIPSTSPPKPTGEAIAPAQYGTD